LSLAVKEATIGFQRAQEAVMAALSSIPKPRLDTLSQHITEPLAALKGHIHGSDAYRLFRLLNPCFGYLIAVSFIGIPLVKFVSDLISKKQAPMESYIPSPSVAPLWLDRLMPSASGTGAHGEASGNEEVSSVYAADGPALLGNR
jgi:hypothetical protein